MRILLATGGALALLLIAFVAVSFIALESGGVVVAETHTADGSTRSTHLWFAELDGELWLEAGTPENGWYLDVQAEPVLELERDGDRRRYRAHPVRDSAMRDALRRALSSKYGWRDAWVALVVDTGASVPVRLEPLADDGAT